MIDFRLPLASAATLLVVSVAVSAGPAKLAPKAHRIPTFAKDVAPILYSKCATCHHAGEVTPFTLTSYEDASAKAPTIAAAVKQKFMPPWQAISHGQFANERTLTAAQIETIDEWANAGAPKGDMSAAPAVPKFTPGWAMGQPDFVGKPSAAYTVSAEGNDDYRCFVIPTDFKEDRYVTGVEVRPGNRSVVHHVLIYLDKSGVALLRQGEDGKPGYTSFGGPGFQPIGSLGGWAPGLGAQMLPNGDGFLLPKGTDVVLQVHYHKNGKEESDLTQIGLDFAKKPVDKVVHFDSVDNEMLVIPAGDKHFEVKADLDLREPITVLDVIPHMHLLGHDMAVTATLPNGEKKELIRVEPYSFNWQTQYQYKEPVHLPKGTHIALVAHYDNSADNPTNPFSPPHKVMFGEQTTNEMCFAFFTYTFDQEHKTSGVAGPDEGRLSKTEDHLTIAKIFDYFDADHDSFLDANELAGTIEFLQNLDANPKHKHDDPVTGAKFVVAMYGKTQKGKVNKDEFLKMLKAFGGDK